MDKSSAGSAGEEGREGGQVHKIVISYHGRQGGFFDPFSNARGKKGRSRFFPEHLKRGAKNYPT
jgi:hypothetical protein